MRPLARQTFALVTMLCALLAAATPALGVEWGTSEDKIKKGDLGKFNGSELEYEVRTQFASLHSSHVRVMLFWYDNWAGEKVEQTLIEDERAARLEDYALEQVRGKATVRVSYLCPKDRKDTTTQCTEIWVWQKNSRRFELEGSKSTDPVAESYDQIAELIKRGKVEQAKRAVENARGEFGKDGLDPDALFALFWGHAIDEAYDTWRAGKKAAALAGLRAFLKDSPVKGVESCPATDALKVCLEDRKVCGCAEPYGQIRASQWSERETKRWEKRYGRLAKMVGKASDHHLTEQLLVPALEVFPTDKDLLLTVADMYWETDRDYKARPYYAKLRKLSIAEKFYVPNRVYERFDEEKGKAKKP